MGDKNELTEAEKARNKAKAETSFGRLAKKGEARGEVVHGKHQGEINADIALEWCWQWGWTYETILQKLLDLKRRPAKNFCEREILRLAEKKMGYPSVYVIHQKMVERAQAVYENNLLGDKLNPTKKPASKLEYFWPEKRSIPYRSLVEHDRIAQNIAVDELHKQPDVHRKENPWQLTSGREFGEGKKGAVPDFVIRKNNDGQLYREWHEIEINGKYKNQGAELAHQLYTRDIALKEGRFQKIIWHCVDRRTAIRTLIALSQPFLKTPMKTKGGGFAFDPSKPHWDPSPLRNVSEFWLFSDSKGVVRGKVEQITHQPDQGEFDFSPETTSNMTLRKVVDADGFVTFFDKENRQCDENGNQIIMEDL